MTNRVNVAVGIVINQHQEVLIAKRAAHQHKGGKWEFPGGKIEANEKCTQALARELLEEVGITVEQSSPFMELSFDYSDKQVFLNIHKVTKFAGNACGIEGQAVLWVAKDDLVNYEFPEANIEIINKLIGL